MKVYYILLCVYNVAGSRDNDDIIKKVRNEDSKRRIAIEKMSEELIERTELLEGYDLVARRVTVDLKQFENYGHMSIISFPIMNDVSDARFAFQSKEIHLNKIGSCEAKDVIVNIKRASLPAVNPDNYSFPEDFISTELREKVHTIEMRSNGKHQHYTIENPKPGNWYGLVYIKWEDPKLKPVEQKGLVPDCVTVLYTDLQVKQEHDIEVMDCYTGLSIDYADVPAIFKCMTTESIEPIDIDITITNITTDSKTILFSLQALTFPSEDEYIISCTFEPKLSNVQTLQFTPYPEAWHYVVIKHVENISKYDDCAAESIPALDEYDTNNTIVELMRDDKGRFFTFEYGSPTTDVRETATIINMTTEEMKTVKFQVNEVVDIGGNLIIKATLLMSLEYYVGYFTPNDPPLKIVICLNLGYASIPLETGYCIFNDKIKPAFLVLNNTQEGFDFLTSVVPFPDSGTWYMTLRLFYIDLLLCFCRTSRDGRKFEESVDGKRENKSEISNFSKSMKREHKPRVVMLTVASSTCMYDDCSDHGECKIQTRDMVMSFCSCHRGYGGWDCSDESRMDSRAMLITAILLLTLSNVFFLITVYVAFIRLYYTEAVMYGFTMIFSTLYHSCNAPEVVAKCIVKEKILQFSDFFCGLMCFWVTLLAMSTIPDTLRNALQLAGAVAIAVAVTWDKHSLLTFSVPFITGSIIAFGSWWWYRIKNGHWSYLKSYYTLHFPSGIFMVTAGLMCYALFQTENNYKTVHSFWHALIALSVVFLLPDVRRGEFSHPFKPSPNFCRLSFFKIFKKARSSAITDTENNR